MSSIVFPAFETLTTEVREGTAVLTVNRQAQLNALNRKVLSEISDAVDQVEDAPDLVALIITGAGPKAFVAGADIAEMRSMSPESARDFSRFGQEVFARLHALPCLTVAAVNGYALGGGNELAMACDLRFAARNAKFGQPEVGLGVIPGFGGTWRLARLVGEALALELLSTGKVIDADEALRIGLVSRVVPEGTALTESLALAAEIAKRSPFAVLQVKKAVSEGLSLGEDDGLLLERHLFSDCFAEADQREGMSAFLEKRAPAFRR